MLQMERETFESTLAETIDHIAATAPVLVPYLGRVAAVKENYCEMYNRLQPASGASELELGLLALLTDEDIAESVTPRAQHLMAGIYLPIAEALAETPDEANISWQSVVTELLAKTGEQPTEADRHMQLLSAFTASLISDDLMVRRDFIDQVHSRGFAGELAVAIDKCHLTVICPLDDSSLKTRRYNHYAASFRVPAEAVDYYLQYTNPEAEHTVEARAKLRQRELTASYADGSANPDSVVASQAESRAEHGKQGSIIDPHKIERFALQQMFMQDQLLAFFPDKDLHASPFAVALREKAADEVRYGSALSMLVSDTRIVSDELTEAVATLYRPSGDDSQPLTHRQAAGQRFKELSIRTANLREISKYIDHNGEYIADGRRNQEIHELSAQAAAAPGQAQVLLSYIVREVGRYQRQTGDNVSAEELHQLCLHNRKHLIRLSMVNIGDLSVLTQSGAFQAVNTHDHGRKNVDESTLQRQPDGTLTVGIPLAKQQLKGGAKTHEGTTLGCPAGRVGHDELHHSAERCRHATNNLIDYTVEAIINEAYHRGIFDIPLTQTAQ